MARLTLCADDYAISPAVTAGILELIAAGGINATSAMTNMPFWPAAAQLFHPYGQSCQLGLHLNLTCGVPLTQMPHLAPGGRFPKLPVVMRAGDQAELQAEIMAQLDAFVVHFGAPPQFLDGHQHVHALPNLRAPLFAALEARHLTGRLWLRDPSDRIIRIFRRGQNIKKALLVAFLTRDFGRAARLRGFETNDGFSGFSTFSGKNYAGEFASYLRAQGPNHLIMCHPGHIDEALRLVDSVVEPREGELAFLLDGGFAVP